MTHSTELIERLVSDSIRVQNEFFRPNSETIVAAAGAMAQGLRHGRKSLLFGNGGSAEAAQHIVEEFVGSLIQDRRPLPAISLSTDTSVLTALGNDYGYTTIFARQILALGNADDVAIGISTSGNSPNVIEAMNAARTTG